MFRRVDGTWKLARSLNLNGSCETGIERANESEVPAGVNSDALPQKLTGRRCGSRHYLCALGAHSPHPSRIPALPHFAVCGRWRKRRGCSESRFRLYPRRCACGFSAWFLLDVPQNGKGSSAYALDAKQLTCGETSRNSKRTSCETVRRSRLARAATVRSSPLVKERLVGEPSQCDGEPR